MHAELRRPGMTLELLHIEYLREHPDGYPYTGFSNIGGVPKVTVPDQLRSEVRVPSHDEPIARTYADFGRHYETATVLARPRKPRDEAKVEVGVQVAQRWILARLRNETFFSLATLNARTRELLDELNLRPTKKLGGVSRRRRRR